MQDLYESIRSNPHFNRLEIGELLFAEYTCPIGEERLGIYADTDYLVHVVSGRKTWITADGEWPATTGDTLFFRKGAAIVRQFFEADFCLLIFFVPDRLIRETVRKLSGRIGPDRFHGERLATAARVEHDVLLQAFLQSMLTYFSGQEKPSEPLLRLKLEELIVGILTGSGNPRLASYFRSLAAAEGPSVREIMDANFRFNLSLDEYARLCHRSLSSFKRDFRREFDETPARWLLARRLDYAAALLRSTSTSVTDIVFDCGFEDVSHFSRVFKERFHSAPTAYRESCAGHVDPQGQAAGRPGKAGETPVR